MSIAPMIPVPFKIQKKVQQTHDVFELELAPVKDGNITMGPGQFNMLYLFGIGEVPISVSGDLDQALPLIHTIRSVGTVTKAMSELKEGSMLGVRGPFGSQWPVKEAIGKDVLLMAGGIGMAPLRPVLYHLLANRDQFGRIILLYGSREPKDMLFQDQLRGWPDQGLELHQTVDVGDRSWQGSVGVVTRLLDNIELSPEKTLAMVCGPEIMMKFAIQDLERKGLTHEQIYISMERNMKCAVGFCGHCQFGPTFICKDGPVFRYDQIRLFFNQREI